MYFYINLKLLSGKKPQKVNTVFPRIVSVETILFWKLRCDKYSREETIQRRKLFIFHFFIIVRILDLATYRNIVEMKKR